MKTIESILTKEVEQLKKIIQVTEKRLKNKPNGYLRISKKKNTIEYYLQEGNCSGNGRYIKKKEEKLVRAIAQRDYDVNVLKYANERLKAIEIFLKKYSKTGLQNIYDRMHPYRKELIDAVILSDEAFVQKWQAVTYEGKGFSDDEKMIITEKGERVRSKSEKIIADKLYLLGIPYRYEFPIILEENIKIYPDFTILKMPTREEVYLEHFGKMDDADYVNMINYKLNTYERNGIYMGVQLFITHETERNPLNTKVLDKMLRELFCIK